MMKFQMACFTLDNIKKGRRFIYLSGASTGNDPGTGNYFNGKRV